MMCEDSFKSIDPTNFLKVQYEEKDSGVSKTRECLAFPNHSQQMTHLTQILPQSAVKLELSDSQSCRGDALPSTTSLLSTSFCLTSSSNQQRHQEELAECLLSLRRGDSSPLSRSQALAELRRQAASLGLRENYGRRSITKQRRETPEQSEIRRIRARIRSAERRQSETPDEYARRLERMRILMANKRRNETVEEREKRLADARLRMAQKRLGESAELWLDPRKETQEQRRKRLLDCRLRMARRRSNETSEEREKRLRSARNRSARRRGGTDTDWGC